MVWKKLNKIYIKYLINMNDEYYNNIFGNYKKSKFGDYLIYSGDSRGSDEYCYADWTNIVSQYYDSKSFVEETEDQKNIRLAKEKAKLRENKIDSILGN